MFLLNNQSTSALAKSNGSRLFKNKLMYFFLIPNRNGIIAGHVFVAGRSRPLAKT